MPPLSLLLLKSIHGPYSQFDYIEKGDNFPVHSLSFAREQIAHPLTHSDHTPKAKFRIPKPEKTFTSFFRWRWCWVSGGGGVKSVRSVGWLKFRNGCLRTSYRFPFFGCLDFWDDTCNESIALVTSRYFLFSFHSLARAPEIDPIGTTNKPSVYVLNIYLLCKQHNYLWFLVGFSFLFAWPMAIPNRIWLGFRCKWNLQFVTRTPRSLHKSLTEFIRENRSMNEVCGVRFCIVYSIQKQMECGQWWRN